MVDGNSEKQSKIDVSRGWEREKHKTYRNTMEEVVKANQRRTTKIERDPVYINYLKCSVILLFRPFLMLNTKQISGVHTHVYFRWTKQISVHFVASIGNGNGVKRWWQ